MKLWGARFSKELNTEVNSFNSSIAFDWRLFEQDIVGSLAHSDMLAKQGIISLEDKVLIHQGLLALLEEIKSGELCMDPNAEDIHMFIETQLTKRIGKAGKKLHTARSRNDQVALDTKSYLLLQGKEISVLIYQLLEVLYALSKENQNTIMPGYTHLQRAHPISFAHHLMAYVQMFTRDIDRLKDWFHRTSLECPLGSGALAGTTYPIDRHYTSNKLGFMSPCANSLDGVSDRDYCIELTGCLSILMMHLSRFCEEIILWCSWEFQFIELDDAFSTGSSIMPQKKNPDIAELIRGKSGRVYGSLITLLTMMKALPLAYNKDMQEDKEAVFDAVDTTKECLSAFTPMLHTITVKPKNMRKAAAQGFINATDCADYLVKKGLPFRDAYTLTGQLVSYCIEKHLSLEDLSLQEYQGFSPLFQEDLYEAISLENCVNSRT
ncbi:MAG: argininosuccinate lyase, partial [Clostridiales bacterium]|nr:argininosuccinate lyase [Clostridiales bacterium]